MRSTKVLAFSVPPQMEKEIHTHAKSEHRTTSEYIREAVRHYMLVRGFSGTQKSVSKKLKSRGISPKDIAAEVESLRKAK